MSEVILEVKNLKTHFFTTQGMGLETMRLNFTMVDEKSINSAIETLSEVIQDNTCGPADSGLRRCR